MKNRPTHRQLDVQFILKKRRLYGNETIDVEQYPEYCVSSGLLNSAKFVAGMLAEEGVRVRLEQVTDANSIDRVVSTNKPRIVIIEALWVTPAKLKELARLHPDVKWVIRLHSNTPFLANEGIAFDWIRQYFLIHNVVVAGNHPNIIKDLTTICHSQRSEQQCRERIAYLPNYYDTKGENVPFFSTPNFKNKSIDVGCFGAIRPLKNQCQQAVAAIDFCDQYNLKLRFHINSERVENKGDNVLKNLEALFANHPQHELVKHPWLEHDNFLHLVSKMDLGMQVSFSETFNIVAADFVVMGVPVVVSKEIGWMPSVFKANPTSPNDIRRGIIRALTCLTGPWRAVRALRKYDRKAQLEWMKFVYDESFCR